ncbi:DEAD/DEAH box helicase [Methylobacterium dankookense]|uniref:DEAD-box ATP-dependent RNA helicase RhpA n=1 Tax=Methylobacterium dankookense TaxID=560405 RepID=A0A564FYP2_9HYPH|nr:DEAD/DEAH box helicase [Methylobacterium dankookense]GJD54515.1 ATP-dependent RNA helicase RhlE [Methylobacterium dankookense]VUF13265.1 ATP-dependent RNA helicase RhlE [Methylobacterium dankookense]
MPFTDLGLSDKVLQAVSAAGYTEPTPIQAQAIPHVLARRDVLGIAQTGTGKTAAFTLPMLTLLESGRARARMPRTLILEPTRELAAQVEENFERYGTNHKLNVALIIGGVSFADQDAKLTRGTDVLIATPGRLLDHFERGKLLLTGVELLVIDEADRMLDMGFIPDIERIVKMVPFTRQTLFFSATMPPEIERLADMFLHNPERVEVARPASTAETIVQRLVATGSEGHTKRERLRRLIRGAEELKNGIIFCNRKRDVAQLQKSLVSHGFAAAALHGDMDQRARMAALDAFRSGEMPLLVASDVAARGLDIPAVSHVFNFDVPHHPEDYVHRIGRTGRAGRAGHAFTLVSRSDGRSLQAIEALIGQQIAWMDGDLASLPEESDEAEPRSRHRGGRSGGTERRTRGKGAGEARGESRPRRSGGQRERGESAPRAQESRTHEPRVHEPAARVAEASPPREMRAKERREPEGDTPIGLGSHVPAFLLRPAPVKKER